MLGVSVAEIHGPWDGVSVGKVNEVKAPDTVQVPKEDHVGAKFLGELSYCRDVLKNGHIGKKRPDVVRQEILIWNERLQAKASANVRRIFSLSGEVAEPGSDDDIVSRSPQLLDDIGAVQFIPPYDKRGI